MGKRRVICRNCVCDKRKGAAECIKMTSGISLPDGRGPNLYLLVWQSIKLRRGTTVSFKTKSKIEASKLNSVEIAGETQTISRRRMLGLTAATGIALAGVGLEQSSTAKAHSWLTVEVVPVIVEFTREPAEGDVVPTGPFYSEGPIYAEGTLDEKGTAPDGTQSIGTFRCWGWVWDGSGESIIAGSAQQSYELDGLGEIQAQGRDMASKAVIGGTDAFRNASGELVHEDINVETFTFRATFTE